MTRDALHLVPSIRARRGEGGRFVLTRKFIDGVREYVRRWPGPVVVHVEETHAKDTNLDPVSVHASELDFTLRWLPASEDKLSQELRSARLVLGTLVDERIGLAKLCAKIGVPLVYITEYSLRTRKQIIATQTSNPLLRLRRGWWTTRLERRCEQAVRLATGVQCNGTPTYDAYRSLNPRALLYFDTRVPNDMLVDPAALLTRTQQLLSGGPLRLAFSGRLIAMKGADHLPRVAAELSRLNVPFTMDLCGGGDLETAMKRDIEQKQLSDRVRMRGVLDFRRELMPFIAQQVDLFVCCHRQGDPSCTYLETLSCGTPIAGYDNEAWTGLSRIGGVGWTSAMNDPAALARTIVDLHRNRAALVEAAHKSRAFAAQHTFERTMQARVDHLLSCCAAAECLSDRGHAASSSSAQVGVAG